MCNLSLALGYIEGMKSEEAKEKYFTEVAGKISLTDSYRWQDNC